MGGNNYVDTNGIVLMHDEAGHGLEDGNYVTFEEVGREEEECY
jgi:hypothetical protein